MKRAARSAAARSAVGGIALKGPRSKVPIVYIIVAFETEQ